MQRIMMMNDEGQWYATGVNAASDLLDRWSDDQDDAIEFRSARAAELVYRYNRKHRGTGAKAERFNAVKAVAAFDCQDRIAEVVKGIDDQRRHYTHDEHDA